MKTLADIRDGLAEEYFPTFGSGAFTQGFDAGAKAVMEQAQKLVEALEKTSAHAEKDPIGETRVRLEIYKLANDTIKEWQEFVGSQK